MTSISFLRCIPHAQILHLFSKSNDDKHTNHDSDRRLLEQFDEADAICGVVVSVRQRQDEDALWTKAASNEAAQLDFYAHDGQKRRSGEPFIIHPVEVARILVELELDWESTEAGLLHDTVEDTHLVTFKSIEEEFGATVRHIVEGETKVSKLGKIQCKNEHDSVQDVKADDLRQMFLAMTEEVRVIIVKLADRLHNMRTLSHMPPHKQEQLRVAASLV